MTRALFRPVNDKCIDCSKDIEFTVERNYIVWDWNKGEYRRQCAACHDKEKDVPFERKSAHDAVMAKL